MTIIFIIIFYCNTNTMTVTDTAVLCADHSMVKHRKMNRTLTVGWLCCVISLTVPRLPSVKYRARCCSSGWRTIFSSWPPTLFGKDTLKDCSRTSLMRRTLVFPPAPRPELVAADTVLLPDPLLDTSTTDGTALQQITIKCSTQQISTSFTSLNYLLHHVVSSPYIFIMHRRESNIHFYRARLC